jgi:hypothetical protein
LCDAGRSVRELNGRWNWCLQRVLPKNIGSHRAVI